MTIEHPAGSSSTRRARDAGGSVVRVLDGTSELRRRRGRVVAARDGIDDLPVAVLVFVDGGLVRVNDRWTALTGFGLRSSFGASWLRAVHPDDRSTAAAQAHSVCRGTAAGHDIRLRRHRGGYAWAHVKIRAMTQDRRQTCVMTLTEIDVRKANESRLAHLASHDLMTGLLNKQAFMAELEVDADRPHATDSTAMLFVDLDDFKVINDLFGHRIGDQFLVYAAQRIRSAARASDVVGRLGGDEFGVLCRGLRSPEEAGCIAARIVEAMDAPLALASSLRRISVSVGVAHARSGATAAAVVDEADRAMYRAKACGGAQWARLPSSTSAPGDEAAAFAGCTGELLELDALVREAGTRLEVLSARWREHEDPQRTNVFARLADGIGECRRLLASEEMARHVSSPRDETTSVPGPLPSDDPHA
ncbi:MAG: diguanylate cyclase [Ilumatobacteraceae bacterium]|nr:diguanylate cyclase [Ilumatobacteraceae bacterium]